MSELYVDGKQVLPDPSLIRLEVYYLDIPANTALGSSIYTVSKVITPPDGFIFKGFGAIANSHWGQTLIIATYGSNTITIKFYNTLAGTLSANPSGVQVYTLWAKS